jgi:hypothetical protein
MSHRLLSVVGSLALTVPLAGCELLDLINQRIDLPLDLTTPPQDFDVTEAVTSVESGACAEADSPACVTLKAICRSEEGRDCTTAPSLPGQFPAELEVVPGDPPVSADEMMETLGVREATEMELALPVDVAAALEGEGVATPDAVQNVSISGLVMEWPENTLTFDLPALDLYIAKGAVDPGELDAKALIESGDVEQIGTIGIDIDEDGVIDIGQRAGSADPVPVNFVTGGSELMTAAFRTASFTVVTAVPEGKGLRLKEEDGVVTKPTGKGTVQLKATLLFSVKASDIVQAAQEAP